MDPDWVQALRDAAVERAIPFFFLQRGGMGPAARNRVLDGRVWEERPQTTHNGTEDPLAHCRADPACAEPDGGRPDPSGRSTQAQIIERRGDERTPHGPSLFNGLGGRCLHQCSEAVSCGPSFCPKGSFFAVGR